MNGKKNFPKVSKKLKNKKEKVESFTKFQNDIKITTAQNKSRSFIR